MISAPEAGDILNPVFLSNLEKFESYIGTASSNVGKVQTIVPSIKRINKLMNQDTVPYEMPEMAESVSFDFFNDDGLLGEDSPGGDSFPFTNPRKNVNIMICNLKVEYTMLRICISDKIFALV